MVAQDDIADAAVAVLRDPARARRPAYDLTGPAALSLGEAARPIAEATGRPVSYHAETIEEAYASRASTARRAGRWTPGSAPTRRSRPGSWPGCQRAGSSADRASGDVAGRAARATRAGPIGRWRRWSGRRPARRGRDGVPRVDRHRSLPADRRRERRVEGVRAAAPVARLAARPGTASPAVLRLDAPPFALGGGGAARQQRFLLDVQTSSRRTCRWCRSPGTAGRARPGASCPTGATHPPPRGAARRRRRRRGRCWRAARRGPAHRPRSTSAWSTRCDPKSSSEPPPAGRRPGSGSDRSKRDSKRVTSRAGRCRPSSRDGEEVRVPAPVLVGAEQAPRRPRPPSTVVAGARGARARTACHRPPPAPGASASWASRRGSPPGRDRHGLRAGGGQVGEGIVGRPGRSGPLGARRGSGWTTPRNAVPGRRRGRGALKNRGRRSRSRRARNAPPEPCARS